MNILKELRKLYPKYGFFLHDDGVIVTLRGGHRYLMTLAECTDLILDAQQVKKVNMESVAKSKGR